MQWGDNKQQLMQGKIEIYTKQCIWKFYFQHEDLFLSLGHSPLFSWERETLVSFSLFIDLDKHTPIILGMDPIDSGVTQTQKLLMAVLSHLFINLHWTYV